MNRFLIIAIALAVLGGVIKYLNDRGDKQVQEQLIENARKAVDYSVKNTQLPSLSVIQTEYAGTQIIKMAKVNDLTLSQTLQLSNGYDNLSEKDTNKMQKYFTDYTVSVLCAKPDIKDFIRVGMVNLVTYEFANGKKITDIRVDKASCEPYWKAA